ncbi:MCM AAA-lid domain [Popillia japonica]|uniref:DNA helicase MCM8 n=1 Tax=Popillia japonica TaxID=7064 RepID=A0AAW1NLX3_POPJA
MDTFQSFIQDNLTLFPLMQIREENHFSIDLSVILNNQDVVNNWENFRTEIFENANTSLKTMALAIHQTIIEEQKESALNQEFFCKPINVRLHNVEPIRQLKDLKANLFEKLISVRSTVIKVGVPRLQCQYMAFKCASCENIQVAKQLDGNYTLPTKCLTKGCKSHNFVAQLESPFTRTINYQVIKLQEINDDIQDISGRVPRTVECDLTEDLVSSCIPGDDVLVTGMLKVRSINNDNQYNRQSPIYMLYIDCVSIINEKANSQNAPLSRILFNTSDIPAIQKIHSEPQLFRFLIHSVCLNIYGHEMVKAGLLLALFGGTRTEIEKRSNCHVLMVGDPGLGKSQLLKSCSNLSPRGVYVCGNTSTGSGLTVTMVRESGGGFSLEAGALILADQGCCCIDEFDKMTNQHSNLLEVMEQQCISIAKAGISRSLHTRTSVLAAANPAGGHYNKAKTVAENLEIGSPLLSRFDLIFILLDYPNEHLDMLLSEHVLALHSGGKSTSSNSDASLTPVYEQNTTLKSRLTLQPGEAIDHLPHTLFRSYIAYAQKYVNPRLSEGAKDVLKQFYLELRQKYHVDDSTPVTARQLESMKRLTQARAKVELRNEATAEDAIEVVEIMRHSLVDVFTDEFGVLDFTRSPNGAGISNRKQISKFLNLLQRQAEIQQKSTFNIKALQEVAVKANVQPLT